MRASSDNLPRAHGEFVKKTKLLDLFGLSGDPADNDRLDDLFLRLEADTSAVSEGISIFVEEAVSIGSIKACRALDELPAGASAAYFRSGWRSTTIDAFDTDSKVKMGKTRRT